MNDRILVLGGGPNGLACATRLAKAGRAVTLLEARGQLGGLAASEEFHPGFRTAGVHLDSGRLRPAVVEELGLTGHGLAYRHTEAARYAPSPIGPPVVVHPGDENATVAALDAHHRSDGVSYRMWRAFLGRMTPFLQGVLDAAPPDVEARTLPALWELGKTALGLRRLGKRDMSELLRVGPMCVADWLNESFQTDRLKVLLAVPGVAATWTGPWSAGSALQLMLSEVMTHRSVIGGPAAVARALESAARGAGVEIRTDAPVERILFADGAVSGVQLAGGEELAAPVLAATCEPKRALLDLIAKRDLPPLLERRAQAWRTRGTTAVLHLALDGPLVFQGCEDQKVESAVLGTDLDGLEKAFDPVKYGELPEEPCLELRVPSVGDESLAPRGKHVATVHAHFVTHDPKGGWTDTNRGAVGKAILAVLARHAVDLPATVVGSELLTPADLEQRYGLTGGQLNHGEPALDQMLHMRPNPECARYATPLTGLYLCGSGNHPGGGVTGMPGLLGARAILGE